METALSNKEYCTEVNFSSIKSLTLPNIGISSGFKINYHGPRLPVETKNLKSVLENPQIALEKVENEIQLGRIAGPFQYSPISNLRCSPIGASIKSLTLPKVG
jgi:hypothetical protein